MKCPEINLEKVKKQQNVFKSEEQKITLKY